MVTRVRLNVTIFLYRKGRYRKRNLSRDSSAMVCRETLDSRVKVIPI